MSDSIDLNADVGEGVPGDHALLALVSSANIACGAHAGDARTMEACLHRCAELGVAAGAHPSYPDREGFGRRETGLAPAAIGELVRRQLAPLAERALAAGTRLAHVKPHGALYHRLAADAEAAAAFARAVRGFDASLAVVGLAGSCLLRAARDEGLAAFAEGFADRGYAPGGALVPRGQPGALIEDEPGAVAQALSIARHGFARAAGGARVDVAADTLCVHGDGPHALAFARALREAFARAGIAVRAPRRG